MERVFGTLQQRLPPLLRLNGITTVEAANRYPRRYLSWRAQRPLCGGRGRARQRLCAFAAGLPGHPVHQDERVVGRDNCVRYDGRIFQIPDSGTATTSSRSPSRCTNTRTARSPSSMAPGGSPATPPTAVSSDRRPNPISCLTPLGGAPCGFVDNAARYHNPTGPQQQKRTYNVLRKADIFTRYRHAGAPARVGELLCSLSCCPAQAERAEKGALGPLS